MLIRQFRAGPLLSVLAAAGSACAPNPVPPPRAVTDEPTRLEQTLAAAVQQRDSVTIDRFVPPEFVLLGPDRGQAAVSRAQWLQNVMEGVSIDSIAVRDVKGTWAGDTLTTELWLYYRGKVGDKPVAAEEARFRDRWLLSGARWRLLSRQTLEHRAVPVPAE